MRVNQAEKKNLKIARVEVVSSKSFFTSRGKYNITLGTNYFFHIHKWIWINNCREQYIEKTEHQTEKYSHFREYR